MKNILEMSDTEARVTFHELCAQREAILAVAEPLRATRDAEVAAHEARRAKMDAELAEAEAGLFEIERARGRIAKMLGGRTGLPDGSLPDNGE